MRQIEQLHSLAVRRAGASTSKATAPQWQRSEEHTSELQSQSNLVCRLLLEKKKSHQHGHLKRRDSILVYLSSPSRMTSVCNRHASCDRVDHHARVTRCSMR